MILKTERLQIFPLAASQLILWTENLPALQKELAYVIAAKLWRAFSSKS